MPRAGGSSPGSHDPRVIGTHIQHSADMHPEEFSGSPPELLFVVHWYASNLEQGDAPVSATNDMPITAYPIAELKLVYRVLHRALAVVAVTA